ncbi:hypothetical protein HY994_01830 [Candidatus Micrarchaeota archaeon]|nr:hypothetical protein [Candidatus Micrarchaeota archaeon]
MDDYYMLLKEGKTLGQAMTVIKQEKWMGDNLLYAKSGNKYSYVKGQNPTDDALRLSIHELTLYGDPTQKIDEG